MAPDSYSDWISTAIDAATLVVAMVALLFANTWKKSIIASEKVSSVRSMMQKLVNLEHAFIKITGTPLLNYHEYDAAYLQAVSRYGSAEVRPNIVYHEMILGRWSTLAEPMTEFRAEMYLSQVLIGSPVADEALSLIRNIAHYEDTVIGLFKLMSDTDSIEQLQGLIDSYTPELFFESESPSGRIPAEILGQMSGLKDLLKKHLSF